MTSRHVRALNAVLLVMGVGLFAALVVRFDVEEVWDRIRMVGWLFAAVLVGYVLSVVAGSRAWAATMERPPRFGRLLGAFWAGTALNAVHPIAGSGEVLKGSILAGRVAGEDVVASLVVYNFLNAVSVVAVTVAGPVACLVWLDLPRDVVVTLLAVSAVLVIVAVLLGALLRRGASAALLRVARRLPVVRRRDLSRLDAWVARVDRRIRDFRRDRPRDFARAAAWIAAVRLLLTIEVFLFLVGLFPERSPWWLLLLAFLVQSVAQIIVWTVVVVPGRFGVLEGGVVLLFEVLGLDPGTGLALAILFRVRKLIGIAMGLVAGAAVGLGRPVEPRR